jgi:hypothetical protein
MPLQLVLALGGRHAARTLFARKSSRYFQCRLQTTRPRPADRFVRFLTACELHEALLQRYG